MLYNTYNRLLLLLFHLMDRVSLCWWWVSRNRNNITITSRLLSLCPFSSQLPRRPTSLAYSMLNGYVKWSSLFFLCVCVCVCMCVCDMIYIQKRMKYLILIKKEKDRTIR